VSENSVNSIVKLGAWNIHGLESSIKDPYFHEVISELEIVFLTETWLDEEIDIPKFQIFSKKRIKQSQHGRGSGGICALYKPHIRKGLKFVETTDNFIWIKLDKYFFGLVNDIYLCGAYIPPRTSKYSETKGAHLFDLFESMICKYDKAGDIMLMGDFNARTSNWTDNIEHDTIEQIDTNLNFYEPDRHIRPRNSCDHNSNRYGKDLISLCSGYRLRILYGRTPGDLLGQYTYHHPNGNSTIDYSIVSENLLSSVINFYVHPPTHTSDHSLIQSRIHAPTKIAGQQMINKYGSSMPLGFKWDEQSSAKYTSAINTPSMQAKLAQFMKSNFTTDSVGVNKAVEELTNILLAAAKRVLKKKRQCRIRGPRSWHDFSCKSMKIKILAIGKILQRYPNDPILSGQFHMLKKSYRKITKQKQKEFYTKCLDKIDSLEQNNPKAFWNMVNKLRSTKKGTDTIQLTDWFKHFKELHNPSTKESDNRFADKVKEKLDHLEQTKMNNITIDNPFQEAEVTKLIKKLKNGKSPAADQITNEMLKSGGTFISKQLTKVVNLVWESGIFPESWARGFIVPIHKKESKADPSNYRGITISSYMGKVFTALINNRITNFLEKNNLIHESQIGFRKGRRTADHIFVLRTIIDYAKSISKRVFCCFVDLSKAFDSVWRIGLFYKMFNHKLGTKVISIVQNMYAKVVACVRSNGKLSNSFSLDVGTRQGCNLSPTLFNMYLNDLPKLLNNPIYNPVRIGNKYASVLLYADDMLLLSYSASGLQKCLNTLNVYCTKWQLNVNRGKTKVLVFNSRKQISERFYYNNRGIEVVSKWTYLGIDFTSSGSFQSAKKALGQKALKAYFSWNHSFSNNNGASISVRQKLFNSTTKPIALYCSEVWGGFDWKLSGNVLSRLLVDDKSPGESLLNRFCKQSLGISRYSSSLMAKAELGLMPLAVAVFTNMVKFWHHLKELPETSLATEALVCSHALDESGKTSYVTRIRHICRTLSCSEVLENSDNNKLQINTFSDRLKQFYIKCFYRKIESNHEEENRHRYDIFRRVYKNYRSASYLSHLANSNLRKEITRFRLSASPLPLSYLRYKNVKVSERLCQACNLHQVGDEHHALIQCNNPTVIEARSQLWSKLQSLCPDFYKLCDKDKVTYLASAIENESATSFGIFLTKIYKIQRT
jgi:exonuclease III